MESWISDLGSNPGSYKYLVEYQDNKCENRGILDSWFRNGFWSM